MSMDNRIDDAQFNIGTPVCMFCQNAIRHEYTDAAPDVPLITCAVYGKVPHDIDTARSQRCGGFVLDAERYEKEKDWLPKGFDPSKINK